MGNLKSPILTEIRINRYLSILLGLALINLAYIITIFLSKGYLPEPFLHNKWDTFMDFYNPLFWANREGIYTDWKSVYPPLNFLILRIYSFIFIDNISEFNNGLDLRPPLDFHAVLLIIIFNILLILSIIKSFSRIFNYNQLIITSIIIALSPVALFALERGNIIILSLYVFSLYVWSDNKLKKVLIFSFLVNLKPYFAVLFFFELLRKNSLKFNKDFLIMASLLPLLIFLITGLLINQEYQLLILNLLGFSSGEIFQPAEIFAFPTSIISYGYLPKIVNINFPIFIQYFPKLIIYLFLILCLLQFYKREISNDYFYIFIVLFLTNYSITTGGYAALFYIPVIPLLIINREYKILALVVLAFFTGIWDMINLFPLNIFDFQVYLSESYQRVEVYFTLASIVRPVANMISLILFYKSLRNQNVA